MYYTLSILTIQQLMKSNFKVMNNKQLLYHCRVACSTYLKFLVSDGYDTAQETSNSQQYG